MLFHPSRFLTFHQHKLTNWPSFEFNSAQEVAREFVSETSGSVDDDNLLEWKKYNWNCTIFNLFLFIFHLFFARENSLTVLLPSSLSDYRAGRHLITSSVTMHRFVHQL